MGLGLGFSMGRRNRRKQTDIRLGARRSGLKQTDFRVWGVVLKNRSFVLLLICYRDFKKGRMKALSAGVENKIKTHAAFPSTGIEPVTIL